MAKPKRLWTVKLEVDVRHWQDSDKNHERFIDSCEIKAVNYRGAKQQAIKFAKANEEMGPLMEWQPKWIMLSAYSFRTYPYSPDGKSTNYFRILLMPNGFEMRDIADEEVERRDREWRRVYLNER